MTFTKKVRKVNFGKITVLFYSFLRQKVAPQYTYWNTAVNDFENVKTKSLKLILCLFKNSPK